MYASAAILFERELMSSDASNVQSRQWLQQSTLERKIMRDDTFEAQTKRPIQGKTRAQA